MVAWVSDASGVFRYHPADNMEIEAALNRRFSVSMWDWRQSSDLGDRALVPFQIVAVSTCCIRR